MPSLKPVRNMIRHCTPTQKSEVSIAPKTAEKDGSSKDTPSVILRRSGSGSIKILQSGDDNLKVVTREIFRDVLTQRQVERSSCLFLPFSVIFFLLYTVMVAQHEDTFMTYQTEMSIRNFVYSAACEDGEELSDTGFVRDVWTWLKGSVVCESTLWFSQNDLAGRPLPQAEWGRVQGSNKIFGGVLLEQLRTEKESCELPFAWDCFPSGTRSVAPFGSWSSNGSIPDPEVASLYFPQEGFVPLFDEEDARRLRGSSGVLGWGNVAEQKGEKWERFSFFLLEWEPLAKLQQRVKYLEEGGWIDSQTEQITVKTILLNPEVGLIMRVALQFNFVRTGGMQANLKLQSAPTQAYRTASGPIFDVAWILLLVFILVTLSKELKSVESLRMYLSDLWNWLDILTIALGIVVIVGFVFQRIAIDDLLDKITGTETGVNVDSKYLQSLWDVHHQADWTFKGTMWYRLLLGDYVMLVMLRFFKAFRAQPRLALVTTTIYAAGADLFHFSIVFVSIFTSFAFASVVLFGRRMQEFSTFPRAAATCFAIVCGDFDGAWSQVAAEHPTTALLWFWSFIILIFFVMLNMVLAIVLDIYTEVRTNAINGDPLWVQIAKVLRGIRNGGLRSLTKFHRLEKDCLENIDELPDKVSSDDIVKICPVMEKSHLEEIMDQCNRLEARQSVHGLSLSDALTMVGVMHTDLKKMQKLFEGWILDRNPRRSQSDGRPTSPRASRCDSVPSGTALRGDELDVGKKDTLVSSIVDTLIERMRSSKFQEAFKVNPDAVACQEQRLDAKISEDDARCRDGQAQNSQYSIDISKAVKEGIERANLPPVDMGKMVQVVRLAVAQEMKEHCHLQAQAIHKDIAASMLQLRTEMVQILQQSSRSQGYRGSDPASMRHLPSSRVPDSYASVNQPRDSPHLQMVKAQKAESSTGNTTRPEAQQTPGSTSAAMQQKRPSDPKNGLTEAQQQGLKRSLSAQPPPKRDEATGSLDGDPKRKQLERLLTPEVLLPQPSSHLASPSESPALQPQPGQVLDRRTPNSRGASPRPNPMPVSPQRMIDPPLSTPMQPMQPMQHMQQMMAPQLFSPSHQTRSIHPEMAFPHPGSALPSSLQPLLLPQMEQPGQPQRPAYNQAFQQPPNRVFPTDVAWSTSDTVMDPSLYFQGRPSPRDATQNGHTYALQNPARRGSNPEVEFGMVDKGHAHPRRKSDPFVAPVYSDP